MRIKSLHLENFKAFGERVVVPMAPITLILGENSAGKSSILQALHLLKQTHESRDPCAILSPSLEHGIVELGSVPELLFDHDEDRILKIRIVFDFEAGPLPLWYLLLLEDGPAAGPRRLETGGLELQFGYSADNQEISLCSLLVVNSDTEAIARFERPGSSTDPFVTGLWKYYGDPHFSHPGFAPDPNKETYSGPQTIHLLQCTSVTESEEFWRGSFEYATKERDQIVDGLEAVLQQLRGRGLDAPDKWDEMLDGQLVLHGVEGLEGAIEFYGSDFSLADFIFRMGRHQVGQGIAVRGFVELDWAGDDFWGHFPERYVQERPDAYDVNNDDAIQDIRSLTLRYSSQLEKLLSKILPIGPYRNPPGRWFNYSGTRPRDVGYRGEDLADMLFKDPELVVKANKWLKRLDTGYELDIVAANTRYSHLYEVRLRDLRRKTPVDVSLKDVGFGISQILPVIVQCLAENGRIISIEQPEVHVHPRLQANLGDLLAESIHKQDSNQCIIETHSEHLVLRLQRLVRTGILEAQDVSIVYVSRGEAGSDVERLRLDDSGNFLDDWPGGFFTERLDELL